jgi:hypothetical protein
MRTINQKIELDLAFVCDQSFHLFKKTTCNQKKGLENKTKSLFDDMNLPQSLIPNTQFYMHMFGLYHFQFSLLSYPTLLCDIVIMWTLNTNRLSFKTISTNKLGIVTLIPKTNCFLKNQ